ncbi:DAK2 domain-containing protein [Leptolinea tardivitalis]|uniref:DAK2 domain-containing protein n=1 Tax=Leptolinea tardivitalis TaxID=229920 RepID=UPI0007847E7A|nr:DAK2 domain-containing protein [Leptolinea tardivitalis]GAP20759.1 dihydroxyacetone kinase [Leptolinea tardivitalis]
MSETFNSQSLIGAIQRASQALIDNSEFLTSLDQAMGDGDLGITMGKVGEALLVYTKNAQPTDLGKFLMSAGMEANKAAPSTMGTLLATALMRAGKEIAGKTEFSSADAAAMLHAAFTGIQERGKANLGDKTVLDAIHPADEALSAGIASGLSLREAGLKALQAAKNGRDSVTSLQNKVGRASWLGERTKGLPDPGCNAFVVVFEAIVGK